LTTFGDPVAGGQLEEEGAVEPASDLIVDVLDAGGMTQTGRNLLRVQFSRAFGGEPLVPTSSTSCDHMPQQIQLVSSRIGDHLAYLDVSSGEESPVEKRSEVMMLEPVVEPMQGGGFSLKDLRHDLDQTRGVVDILERASQELTTIIDWDQAIRRNPLRQRQLHSISQQLAIARGKRASLARMIEELDARPS
jgi:hypothetical protein